MTKNNNNQKPKLYQPSNSTDGDIFITHHCMQCLHCNPDPMGEKQCSIMLRSMVHSINEPEYPQEWVYDANGKPTCTSHEHWDWSQQGNPDNPVKKPTCQPRVAPNQLDLFSGYGQI